MINFAMEGILLVLKYRRGNTNKTTAMCACCVCFCARISQSHGWKGKGHEYNACHAPTQMLLRKTDTHNKPNERETNIFLKSALRSITPTDSVAEPLEKLSATSSYNERRMGTTWTESLRGEWPTWILYGVQGEECNDAIFCNEYHT